MLPAVVVAMYCTLALGVLVRKMRCGPRTKGYAMASMRQSSEFPAPPPKFADVDCVIGSNEWHAKCWAKRAWLLDTTGSGTM